jgi:hypothetical protein
MFASPMLMSVVTCVSTLDRFTPCCSRSIRRSVNPELEGHTSRIPQYSISRTSISYLLIQTYLVQRFLSRIVTTAGTPVYHNHSPTNDTVHTSEQQMVRKASPSSGGWNLAHIATSLLFLFFIVLLVFLFNISHSTFSAVVWWATVGLSGGVYGCITIDSDLLSRQPLLCTSLFVSLAPLKWHLLSSPSCSLLAC